MSSKRSSNAKSKKESSDTPRSAGFLISCDVPTKQFIQHLNETKSADKKFIIKDLDSTHLLVKAKAKDEISRKIDAWLDENVYSSVEKVGEDLDLT